MPFSNPQKNCERFNQRQAMQNTNKSYLQFFYHFSLLLSLHAFFATTRIWHQILCFLITILNFCKTKRVSSTV
jgi:hypothetical protein